jgi:hypothetical protein
LAFDFIIIIHRTMEQTQIVDTAFGAYVSDSAAKRGLSKHKPQKLSKKPV